MAYKRTTSAVLAAVLGWCLMLDKSYEANAFLVATPSRRKLAFVKSPNGRQNNHRKRPRTERLALTMTTNTGASSRSVVEESLTEKTEFLDSLEIPLGLRQELLRAAHQDHVYKRFWIVDNSGSMALMDGHLQITDTLPSAKATGKIPMLSRWEEVSETVQCHAQLAATLEAPTEFRLLNPPVEKTSGNKRFLSNLPKQFRMLGQTPQPDSNDNGNTSGCPQTFRVGYNARTQRKDSHRARSILARAEPKGGTPLSNAIDQVRNDILQVLPQMQEGQRIVLVIATDGSTATKESASLSADAQNEPVLQALQSLQGLPVSVVVRLCTDFTTVIDMYNDLDQNLADLEIDVLDDYLAEAKEVHICNPWLNYALLLHRLREMGPVDPLLDLLDERALDRNEIRQLVGRITGISSEGIGNGGEDWESFVRGIQAWQAKERRLTNPISQTKEPWFNCEQLMQL